MPVLCTNLRPIFSSVGIFPDRRVQVFDEVGEIIRSPPIIAQRQSRPGACRFAAFEEFRQPEGQVRALGKRTDRKFPVIVMRRAAARPAKGFRSRLFEEGDHFRERRGFYGVPQAAALHGIKLFLLIGQDVLPQNTPVYRTGHTGAVNNNLRGLDLGSSGALLRTGGLNTIRYASGADKDKKRQAAGNGTLSGNNVDNSSHRIFSNYLFFYGAGFSSHI